MLLCLAGVARADSGFNFRRALQTDEAGVVACNPAGKNLSAVNTSTVTVRKTDAGATVDGSPGGILGSVTINPGPITAGNKTCAATQCVLLPLTPACGTPPASCRNGNSYQVHVNATASDGSLVDCDVRVDVLDVVYQP